LLVGFALGFLIGFFLKNRREETETTYEKVVNLYMSGITTPIEIAKKLNVHRTTASRYLKKALEAGILK